MGSGTLAAAALLAASLGAAFAAGPMAVPAAAAAAAATEEDPELIYLTLEEALAEAFPRADSLWTEPWTLSADERRAIERGLGWKLDRDTFVFHRALRRGPGGDGEDLGWAVVTEEIGHHRPITFMVHVEPDGDVGSVHVMVYRESRGGEIRRERFLRQYRGKDRSDPLRLDRDIVGVSGATLSVRAANASVRRVLALVAARYGSGADDRSRD